MAALVFVATSAPPGWQLGRWMRKSDTIWEESKAGEPNASYQFDVVACPSLPESSTVRLRMRGTTTEALLLERTAQIFVDGQYLGEYGGAWQGEDGGPPPALPPAPPPARGSDAGWAPPLGQKSAPPPPQQAAFAARQQQQPQQPPQGAQQPAYAVQQQPAYAARQQPAYAAQHVAAAAAAPMAQAGMPPVAAAPGRPLKAANLDRSPAMATKLLQAALSGDAAGMKRLLDANADPDVTGVDGTSPLLAAAGNGSVGVVEALLAAGADPNLGKDGTTPMTVAFQRGNKEVLRALFSAAFQSLESAVGPGPAASPGGAAPKAQGADDEVPETAIYELREVTAKLAELGKTQRGGGYAPADLDEVPQAGNSDKLREEAIKGAMMDIARATN